MALSSLTPWDLCGNQPVCRRRGDGVEDTGDEHVVVGEEARAGDEAVRARGGARADRLGRGLDAAVDLDIHIQVTVDDPLADLLLCGNQNFTARSC